MITTKHTFTLLVAGLLLSGCDAPEEVAGDEQFRGGSVVFGIEEGSGDALAVLALVNSASIEQLDDSAEVGLDVRAAEAIYEQRVGPDGVEGSEDDVPYETLAQLDAAPYVAQAAFSKLLAYALANGYAPEPVDPFSDDFCADGPFTYEDALAHLQPGQNFPKTLSLVEGGLRTYSRTCGPTGCGEWKSSSEPVRGKIKATSQGAVWYPKVSMTGAEIWSGLVVKLTGDRLLLSSTRPTPISVYYPETGSFAWQQQLRFHSTSKYGTGAVAATFNETGSIDGESTLRVGQGCFQFKNLDKRGSTEVLTTVYGLF